MAWAGLGMSGTQEVPARLQTRAGSRSCLDRAPGNAAFCAVRMLTWPAAYRAAQKRHRNSGRSHLIVRFAQRVHKSLWPVHTNCRSLSSSFQLARCWHWVHPGHRQKAGQMDVGEGVGPANSRKCRCPGCDALLCSSPGPGDRRVTALSLFPTCPSAWWWFVCCWPVLQPGCLRQVQGALGTHDPLFCLTCWSRCTCVCMVCVWACGVFSVW